MRIFLSTLALSALVAVAAPVVAHPGHDHKVMGTVVSVTGQSVLIKTTDGKEQTFQLTAVTKMLNGKKKGDARELKSGMRVVVNVGDGKEPLKAKEVQYTMAAAATKE